MAYKVTGILAGEEEIYGDMVGHYLAVRFENGNDDLMKRHAIHIGPACSADAFAHHLKALAVWIEENVWEKEGFNIDGTGPHQDTS